MSTAILEGRPFRLNPHSVSWDFTVSVSETKTIGGKVVQVYGGSIGDLTLEGDFGKGGWQEQRDFLARLTDLGAQQLDNWPLTNRAPFRFFWPERGWDFKVWLKSFTEPGSSVSVMLNEANINPKWSLTLFIVEDNGTLKTISQDSFIERLAAGIGWRRTRFSGPEGIEQVMSALNTVGATNFKEYLSVGFGLVQQQPASTSGSSSTGVGGATGVGDPAGNKAYAHQLATSDYGWSGAELDALDEVVDIESKWDQNAQNPTSTAYGIGQFLDTTWGNYDDIAKTSDPALQIKAMLNYIKGRYGDPLNALRHEHTWGWY